MGYRIESSDIFVGRRRFREELPTLIERARDSHSKIIITEHGEPDAVCLPVTEYEALMELLEDMHDRNILLQVAKSRKEIEHGEAQGLEELEGFLELEK